MDGGEIVGGEEGMKVVLGEAEASGQRGHNDENGNEEVDVDA